MQIGHKKFNMKEKIGVIDFECDDSDCLVEEGRGKGMEVMNKGIKKALIKGNALPPSSICNIETEYVDVGFIGEDRVGLEGVYNININIPRSTPNTIMWGEIEGEGFLLGGNSAEIDELVVYMEDPDYEKVARVCI